VALHIPTSSHTWPPLTVSPSPVLSSFLTSQVFHHLNMLKSESSFKTQIQCHLLHTFSISLQPKFDQSIQVHGTFYLLLYDEFFTLTYNYFDSQMKIFDNKVWDFVQAYFLARRRSLSTSQERASFIRVLSPFMKVPPSWPNYLPKPYFLISSSYINILGVRISIYECWEITFSSHHRSH
jgi:hypothetical protein